MDRADAERERDRLAAEHPEATWLVRESDDGWEVLRVGIPAPVSATGSATQARPKPPDADDPRHVNQQTLPWPGGG